MSADEIFWGRVDRLLDERRDPLEDGEVQGAIARRSELLAPLLSLLARVEAVEALPARTASGAPARRALLAAAALVLSCALLAGIGGRSRPPQEGRAILSAAGERPPSRVLSFELAVTTASEDGRRTCRSDGRSVTLEERPPSSAEHRSPPGEGGWVTWYQVRSTKETWE